MKSQRIFDSSYSPVSLEHFIFGQFFNGLATPPFSASLDKHFKYF